MAVRPVDLQQVLVQLPEVGRDAATQQQQPAAAQQLLANEEAKRRQENAETVKQFDETGMAAVHERGQREDQEDASGDEQQAQGQAETDEESQAVAAARAAQARLGRHIDIQA
jgi:hypothetical protein